MCPERLEVTGRAPVPPPEHLEDDPNPRGGMRGGRGIAASHEELYLANSSEIHVFGAGWTPRRRIGDPRIANIHEIAFARGSLYVASSCNDTLFRLTPDGAVLEERHLRGLPGLEDVVGFEVDGPLAGLRTAEAGFDFRDPRAYRMEAYDTCHLNAVCVPPAGPVFVSLGQLLSRRLSRLYRTQEVLSRLRLWGAAMGAARLVSRLLPGRRARNSTLGLKVGASRSAIVALHEDGRAQLLALFAGAHLPSHNVVLVGDGTLAHNRTSDGTLVVLEAASGRVVREAKVTDRFLRGLAVLPGDRVILGAGNELLVVDLGSGEVRQRIPVSDDERETVHGICVLPPGFPPVPDALSLA